MVDGKIHAEWDPLEKVVIHRPSLEMRLGLMEPFGSLFERAFSFKGAVHEHRQFEYILRKELGIEVVRFEHEIIKATRKRPELRDELIEKARNRIVYEGTRKDIATAEKEFDDNAKYLDTEAFLHWWMMSPVIEIARDGGTRNIHVNFTSRQPPANLYFMRDQQFVTDKGIVMSRMAKPARRHEPEITQFLWDAWGLDIAHVTEEPGTIEGGEFIPMGHFSLVGLGDRTNRSAIDQLLANGLGVAEVGVVHQPNHPMLPQDQPDPMIDMHLDTYFNVASSHVVVGLVDLWKVAKLEIWHNEGDHYEKDPKETNLYDYIVDKGFEVVPVTTLEQLCYASNFLCIRDGLIAAIETEREVKSVLANLEIIAGEQPKKYGRLLKQAKTDYEQLASQGGFFPHKPKMFQLEIEAYPIVLKNLTGGYGGAHCMTMSLTRGSAAGKTEPDIVGIEPSR